ncbi:Radical SAM domain protein [Thermodesulfatator indicus DSM 15286]|uniref:Radical SAM domain protein n=1 Tax=Thermodesulfatator indicus (strain DSM 15286 / JCM 11887 / CIR29812) TaxID=667014 RepID=F8A9Y9_THEID|nr:B12-binding domain-containing radical SAM protein [Thermodesulfatator indicus]AEH44192.1 Radical SAM domain protein [Thermodesulfatator indicus DSM 15286]
MKVLLVYPYFLNPRPKDYDVRPLPIGLYYLAAVLKQENFQVEILNWYNLNDLSLAKKTFETLRPDIIAFSIFNANRWGGIDLAKVAKEVLPDTPIIFGGVGATYLWEHLLTHFPEIDYVVVGEGEKTFLDLTKALAAKASSKEITRIKGLGLRLDGQVYFTGEAGFIDDIDSLPNPAKFFSFQHVISSRGCPWNCVFCGSPRFWKRKVRFHSAEYFLEQLERLYRRGINFFYVSDDTFTLDKERVIKICEGILKRGLNITWQAISRVDCLDEEIIYWMRRAGCLQISFGVESGSEKIRNKILNKKISKESIKKAFSLCRAYGILPRAYFIYGCPGESKKTIQASIDLMKEIKPLSMLCYILDIYPGTALYDDFKKRAGVNDDIWLKRIEDIMYYETDPNLSAERVKNFGRKLHQAFDKNFPRFVETLNLIDREELYPHHADFLTRLAMTLRYGELAERDIPEKDYLAEKLFLKALRYHPDHHAFLGLGIIYQQRRDFEKSIEILHKGLSFYPKSEQLNVCQAVNYMQLGDFKKALEHLLPFENSPDVLARMAACYQALGDIPRMQKYLARLESLKKA